MIGRTTIKSAILPITISTITSKGSLTSNTYIPIVVYNKRCLSIIKFITTSGESNNISKFTISIVEISYGFFGSTFKFLIKFRITSFVI